MPMHAVVVSLHIAAHAAAPMQSVATVTAVAGRGLEGDRYCEQTGTYSNLPGTGRDVTLIESEAIAALAREYDIQLPPGLARRNIVTRGIALNHLVGKSFIIGAAVLRGMRLCEPCLHMERLAARGTAHGLIHRGGLRAAIVSGGEIRVGENIFPSEETN
jgi:MOSC domain-containing protein YiiM